MDLNPYAIGAFLSATIALFLSWTIYRGGPDRPTNRRLAWWIFTMAITAFWIGAVYASSSAASTYASTVYLVAWWVWMAAQLRFIATLPTPVVRPLRHPIVDRGLLVLMFVAPLAWPLIRDGTVIGLIPFEPFVPWRPTYGFGFDVINYALIAVSSYAVVATLSAWHRAPKGTSARRQMAAYGVAAIYLDATGGAIFRFITLHLVGQVARGDIPPAWEIRIFLLAAPVIIGGFALLMTYAILRAQVFDIHLKIKFALSRTTVAAIFVAMFFLVSEGAAAFFADRTGSTALGLLAAAALVVFIAPLQRFADRVSDKAMPGVTQSPEYLAFRKLEVYRNAVENALLDGVVTDQERSVLDGLKADLGISAPDAARLERDVAEATGVV